MLCHHHHYPIISTSPKESPSLSVLPPNLLMATEPLPGPEGRCFRPRHMGASVSGFHLASRPPDLAVSPCAPALHPFLWLKNIPCQHVRYVFANVSQSVTWLFTFLLVSFDEQKFLISASSSYELFSSWLSSVPVKDPPAPGL